MLCGVQDRFCLANTVLVYLAGAEHRKKSHFQLELNAGNDVTNLFLFSGNDVSS